MKEVQSMENSVLHKLMVAFMSAIIVAGVGVILGQFVPPALLIPLFIVELVLIIMVVFARKKKMGYILMYAFMFISGLTLYASLNYYVDALGGGTVVNAFVIAMVVFCAIAIYGSLTKFNFGFLGNALFFILLALVVIAVVGIFVPFPSIIEMVISLVGILLFSAYTLYDFNKIAKEGLTEEEIPSTVINVYLDFINLFLYILRFLNIFNRD